MPEEAPRIDLNLSSQEAHALYETLEELLESGPAPAKLQRVYRLLGWRILAVEGGAGLTARISELARKAETLEEYETARDQFLDPILGGLERGENRDP